MARGATATGDRRCTTNRLIGTVPWHWESEATGWPRAGITVFDPAVRGRGIGSEALALWAHYLFSVTAFRRLGLLFHELEGAVTQAQKDRLKALRAGQKPSEGFFSRNAGGLAEGYEALTGEILSRLNEIESGQAA